MLKILKMSTFNKVKNLIFDDGQYVIINLEVYPSFNEKCFNTFSFHELILKLNDILPYFFADIRQL